MQKKNWKYKRSLNQAVFRLRHWPRLQRLVSRTLYALRWLFRLGKKPGSDVRVEKLISDQGQYLYLANPKVATRSIIHYFETFDGDNIRVSYDSLPRMLRQQQQLGNFFRFSFVRNPWARVYSCWLDKISNQHKFCDITIISRYRGLYPDMPFDAFVNWLHSAEGQDEFADRHWLSQYRLMTDAGGVLMLDFVGKLEALEQDFQSVAQRLSVGNASLEAKNANQQVAANDPFGYRQHFSRTTRDLVAQRYRQDIELFNYQF